VNVLVNNINDVLHILNFLSNIVFQVIEYNCDGHYVEDVELLGFVVLLHVQEQVVLGGQRTMISDMVDYLLETVLANHIVFYASGCGLPFEMIQAIVVIVGRFPTWRNH
jgi:hypothetical protein